MFLVDVLLHLVLVCVQIVSFCGCLLYFCVNSAFVTVNFIYILVILYLIWIVLHLFVVILCSLMFFFATSQSSGLWYWNYFSPPYVTLMISVLHILCIWFRSEYRLIQDKMLKCFLFKNNSTTLSICFISVIYRNSDQVALP